MSQTNIDLFAAKVAQDHALLSALTTGVSDRAELVERAVAAGQEAGFAFTPAEAEAWLAQNIRNAADGELSDMQLESAAGGKFVQASSTEPQEWIRPPMWMNRS